MAENAKGGQEPDYDADDYDDVENLFDLRIHGNVAIDQPEQDADDNESDY